MANLNKVFLIGNLTRDPELRNTPGGTAVANLGLAVNRRFKDSTGELKEEVCFTGLPGLIVSSYVYVLSPHVHIKKICGHVFCFRQT